jgi:hypothetical protein
VYLELEDDMTAFHGRAHYSVPLQLVFDENDGWISFWDVKDMIIYEDPIISNICLDDSNDPLCLYGLTRNPLETLLRERAGFVGKGL